MTDTRANILTILAGAALVCAFAAIGTPRYGLLPWTAPDGCVVI